MRNMSEMDYPWQQPGEFSLKNEQPVLPVSQETEEHL